MKGVKVRLRLNLNKSKKRSSDQIMKGVYSRYPNPKPIHVVTDLPIRCDAYIFPVKNEIFEFGNSERVEILNERNGIHDLSWCVGVIYVCQPTSEEEFT